MKRNPSALAAKQHDVLVVGGGIQGAAIAWECAARGLSVALVERADFGGGTSANSLKIIHGGIRYLQNGDIARVRESSRERRILMRIAPHLVHPLPTLIPTRRGFFESRFVLRGAMAAYDLLTADLRAGAAGEKVIPPGRLIDADACRARLPGIRSTGLTGAALYYDAQVYNSERLTLAFLQAAAREGASVLNYARAVHLLVRDAKVRGARVHDEVSDESFDVCARLVITATGPWTSEFFPAHPNHTAHAAGALAFNVVIQRQLADVAVGVAEDAAAGTSRQTFRRARLFFVTPWRHCSLIGTEYLPHRVDVSRTAPSRDDIRRFLHAFNSAWPGADVQVDEVSHIHRGVLPARTTPSAGYVHLLNHPQIVDHRDHGLEGCISVVAVKYTTARAVAEHVVDEAVRSYGLTISPSPTRMARLPGGDFEHIEQLRSEARKLVQGRLSEAELEDAICNYGSNFDDVWKRVPLNGPVTEGWIDSRVDRAVGEEMAVHLEDVIVRRTDLGSAGHPGREVLERAADRMARALSWSQERIAREVARVEANYPVWSGAPAPGTRWDEPHAPLPEHSNRP